MVFNNIVLCFCFVGLRLVYPMLPVSIITRIYIFSLIALLLEINSYLIITNVIPIPRCVPGVYYGYLYIYCSNSTYI